VNDGDAEPRHQGAPARRRSTRPAP
jgi:hypothetical protein